jgi:hypothetical protein
MSRTGRGRGEARREELDVVVLQARRPPSVPVSPCRSGLPLPAAAIRIGRNYDTEGQRGEDRVGKGDGRVRTGLIRGVVIGITARRRRSIQ